MPLARRLVESCERLCGLTEVVVAQFLVREGVSISIAARWSPTLSQRFLDLGRVLNTTNTVCQLRITLLKLIDISDHLLLLGRFLRKVLEAFRIVGV